MVASIAVGALALLASTPLSNAAMSSEKTVKMPIGRSIPRSTIIRKRDPQSVTLGNAQDVGLYYVNATVGTPGQTVMLQVDTGSSDVWMFGSSAYEQCNSQGQQCFGNSFNTKNSNSYTPIGQEGEFTIQYETPGSGVVGNYFQDDFSIGDIKLSNLTMAVATQANATTVGIMGIAFASDESIVSNSNGGQPYPNIIDEMVSQGVIDSRVYSLYLDDLEADTGNIIFGGYDTDAYTGDLTVLDIQTDSQTGVIDSFAVVWSLLAVTDSSGSTSVAGSDFPMAAILDSGTTLTVIPEDMFNVMANYFGAQNTQEYGYVVSCSDANVQGSVDYGFGGENGPIISVPFSELALPLTDENGNQVTFDDGSAACQFGFDVAQQGTPVLLGDTFLRSAYVVYDLDNKQIAIANSFYNATKTNIVPISNSTAIASASSAVGLSVSATGTGHGYAPGLNPTGGAGTESGLAATPTYSAGVTQVSGERTSLLGLGVHGVTSTAAAAGGSATSSSSKGAAAVLSAPVRGLPSLTSVMSSLAAVILGSSMVIAIA